MSSNAKLWFPALYFVPQGRWNRWEWYLVVYNPFAVHDKCSLHPGSIKWPFWGFSDLDLVVEKVPVKDQDVDYTRHYWHLLSQTHWKTKNIALGKAKSCPALPRLSHFGSPGLCICCSSMCLLTILATWVSGFHGRKHVVFLSRCVNEIQTILEFIAQFMLGYLNHPESMFFPECVAKGSRL